MFVALIDGRVRVVMDAQGVHAESQSIFDQSILAGALVVLVLAALAGAVAAGINSMPGWLLLVLPLLIGTLLVFARLRITLTPDKVQARLGPMRRVIPVSEIASVRISEYRPLRQFGGWGWRFGRHGARQYAMAGNSAVILTLTDDREVYLGSNDLPHLAEIIDQHVSAGTDDDLAT